MITLRKYLTRDAPLVFIESWYDGGVTTFKKFFHIPFATRAFLYKNGAFQFLTDSGRFEENLPKELAHWSIKNRAKLNAVHRYLIDGLKAFKKVRRRKQPSINQMLKDLTMLRRLLKWGFLGVYVTHHWPRFQDEFAKRGRKLFDDSLIEEIRAWREKEGHIYFSEGVKAVNFLIWRLSRLKNWPLEALKCLSHRELLLALKKGEPPYSEIKKRNSKGFLYINYKIISGLGPEMRKKLKGLDLDIVRERSRGRIAKVNGSGAYFGKRRGIVAVVYNQSQLNKVKRGNILIAPMTSPWYLPAIKKAGAIVTDEGGVGSHAAIIAREFKIPCVIGTKIATQVFKDGDLVEVDAEKGVVRIIKKAVR